MPYTPPSNRSPSSSASSSPQASRRPSFNAASKPPSVSLGVPAPPPALPRSSSYLTRHRRTPSATSSVSSAAGSQVTPQATSDDLKSMVAAATTATAAAGSRVYDDQSSVRQSPPPVTGDRRGMPTGAIISPPDSPSISDDEGQQTRGRRMDNAAELKQLHEAISQLPQQRRASSPGEPADPRVVAGDAPAPDPVDGMRHSFSTTSLDHFSRIASLVSRRSSSASASASGLAIPGSSGRRVSHVRSATEPSISTSPSASSLTCSDEENDLEILRKPPMVRKKSGELVRPALRFGTGRRPSSMPGTPTFSKVVHFDSHLEHVRHFLQVDRPLAVSAGSSPVDLYDSESEYPFHSNGGGGSPKQSHQHHHHRGAPFEWEIVLSNFPAETPARKALPVRLERIWLSADQKFLHGSVAVLNLAFAKSVVCRFTLDYWKTTSEIAAEYSAEILPRSAPQGHDRFSFTIKLADLANLESKTLYFCIRYAVGGKEFWDNNGGSNFQLDFKKKLLPVGNKGVGAAGIPAGAGGAAAGSALQSGSLPRSHSRRTNTSTAPRPVSMPASMDDFDDSSKLVFKQSVHDYLGESEHPALRLKSSQSALALPSDNLASRLTSPSGQAFANRYDFGASLTAAMLAAKDAMTNRRDSGLYMKSGRSHVSPTSSSPEPSAADTASAVRAAATVAVNASAASAAPFADRTLHARTLDRDSRAILAESGVFGPGSIASKSYDEIVSKYCFFVPKPFAPSQDGTLQASGQTENAAVSKHAARTLPKPASPPSTTTSNGSSLAQVGSFHQQPAGSHWDAFISSRDSSMSSLSSGRGSEAEYSLPGMASGQATQQAPVHAGHSMLYSGGAHPNIDDHIAAGSNSSSTSSSSTASPASPASLVGTFPPFAGTPSSDFSYLKDRFPFNNADGHSATTIRG